MFSLTWGRSDAPLFTRNSPAWKSPGGPPGMVLGLCPVVSAVQQRNPGAAWATEGFSSEVPMAVCV